MVDDIKDGETVCEHGNRPFDCLDCPYRFKEKPATKSSTNVVLVGGNIACPGCGCRRPPLRKAGCKCNCHKDGNWNE